MKAFLKNTALILVSACCYYSYSNAQDSTTNNLVTQSWSGAQVGNINPGGTSGGNNAAFNPSTNTILFGYQQRSVAQSIVINEVLKDNAGISLRGYQYQWETYNSGFNRGTLSAGIAVYNSAGNLINNNVINLNDETNQNWSLTKGSYNFTNPYTLNQLGTISLSFTGKDNRWWAGYYGPMVRNVDFRLTYQPDPCTLNPAFSSDCKGYTDIVTSNSIAATSYAINTALSLSGSGVMVHGFNYGFTATFGDAECPMKTPAGICMGTMIRPSYTALTTVTDNDNKTLYEKSITDTGNNTTTKVAQSYILPQSRNLRSLGNYQLVTNTVGNVVITDTWSNWRYTPDPCVVNPLSSTTCEGYGQAYFLQQCAANPLSNNQCPEYAAAYKNQQCTSNPLFDPTCSGYEIAYFNQQCSIDPLYNIGCNGYEKAYFDQQCKKNPLYNIECFGYQEAFYNQQCNLNPLYNNGCPGYAQAYLLQQCTTNQLYSTECPLYKEAFFNQQCTINPLYDSKCAGYADAYFNQQCSANPLYNNLCSGYAKAYFDQQCTLNPLYNTGCPLYQQAFLSQQCNLNQLYSINCPGYQQAYFSQQCQQNPLYNTGCPGYAEAYKSKLFADSCQANPQSNPQCSGYKIQNTTTSVSDANIGVNSDPIKNATEVQVVADAVTNSILLANSTKTDNPVNNTSTQSSSLGQGILVPGLMPGIQLNARSNTDSKTSAGSTNRTRTTQTTTARGQASQQALQQARTLSAQEQKEENTIAAIATVPGFDAYQNAIIPDARLYVQEQIYRRANLPDNQRAQRALSQRSDKLHQDMVNQQYNLKN